MSKIINLIQGEETKSANYGYENSLKNIKISPWPVIIKKIKPINKINWNLNKFLN